MNRILQFMYLGSFADICRFTVVTLFIFLFLLNIPCYSADQDPGQGDSESFTSDKGNILDPFKKLGEGVKKSVSGISMTSYRQNYFLAVNYDSDPDSVSYTNAGEEEPKNYEAKFQVSFKTILWENIFKETGDIYFGYTQRSFWQLYDQALSSPFRETNYEPEVFVRFDYQMGDIKLESMGFNHQSNGRGGELSRSWNRIIGSISLEKEDYKVVIMPWYRIPESEEDDDNPDIHNYLGYGELMAAYRFKRNVFSVLLRNNLRTDENRGAVELGWSFPIGKKVRGFFQYFNGYGESLVDYNDSSSRIGFGLMLNDWIEE